MVIGNFVIDYEHMTDYRPETEKKEIKLMKFKVILLFMLIFLSGCQVLDVFEQQPQDKPTVTFEDKDRNVMATGADLSSVSLSFGPTGKEYFIVGRFKEPKKLEEITQKLLGEELSIYCNEELITSPIIQQVLTSGEFSIGGEYSLEEAKSLVDKIEQSME